MWAAVDTIVPLEIVVVPLVHALHVKTTSPVAYVGGTGAGAVVPCSLSVTSAWMRVVAMSAPDGPPFSVLLATILEAGTVSLIEAVSKMTRLPRMAVTTATALSTYAGRSGRPITRQR